MSGLWRESEQPLSPSQSFGSGYLLFVHVDSHVVHATSHTSTTGMLSVLSNSTVSV